MTLSTDMNTHTAQVIRGALDAGYHVHNSKDGTRYELHDEAGNVVCDGLTLGDLSKEIEKAGLGL